VRAGASLNHEQIPLASRVVLSTVTVRLRPTARHRVTALSGIARRSEALSEDLRASGNSQSRVCSDCSCALLPRVVFRLRRDGCRLLYSRLAAVWYWCPQPRTNTHGLTFGSHYPPLPSASSDRTACVTALSGIARRSALSETCE
jgi:hypothetical protein